jgi:hypothetical protein
VAIVDDDHEYSSLDDLRENTGDRAICIGISGTNPYGNLRLGMWRGFSRFSRYERNSLNMLTDTDEAEHLYYRIKEAIGQNQRIVGTFVSEKSFNITALLVFALMSFFWRWAYHTHRIGLMIGSMILVGLIFLTGYYVVSLRGFSTLDLRPKQERKSAWKQVKDDLVKNAPTELLKAILTLVTGYLLGHYLK